MGKHSADAPELSHVLTAAEVLVDLPDDWFVLDQVHEVSQDVAAVDRVVVGPGGVFVIVSTDWRGPVTFTDGDVLDGSYSRQAEVEVVLDTAVEVARLTGTYAEWIVPVLAVESEESFRGTVMEVQVASTVDLLAVLDEPGSVLPASHVKYAAELLRHAGQPEPEPEPVVEMPPRVDHDTAVVPLRAVPDLQPDDADDADDETTVQPVVETTLETTAVTPLVVDEEPATAAPTGPDGKKLTGRAARVAAALETAAAEAAKVAEHQGGGEGDGKKKRKPKKGKDAERSHRVSALVRLIVLVVLVGVGGLFGPRIVPAVEDAVGKLDGKPACVPASTAAVDAPVSVPVPKVGKNGKKLTKAQQAQAVKRAEARAARLAAKPVKSQALTEATC